MITGLNHITLSVRDLAVSFDFYTEVLSLQPRLRWPEGAYLSAGQLWLALALDASVRAAPLPEYTHVAFTVSTESFDATADKLRRWGAVEWKTNTSEGASLYFLDPNGHKLELHASDLETRLARVRSAAKPGFQFFDVGRAPALGSTQSTPAPEHRISTSVQRSR